MSILYGLDVKFPHQREIKGGGSGQELAPEREHELNGGGVRCPISHIDGRLRQTDPINQDPSPIKILSTLWRTSPPPSDGRVAKSSSSSSETKEVGHSFKVKSLTIYLIEGVTVHLRRVERDWSGVKVKSSCGILLAANLRFVLKEIHFLVCFAQQFYWRGDKVQGRGKAQVTLG